MTQRGFPCRPDTSLFHLWGQAARIIRPSPLSTTTPLPWYACLRRTMLRLVFPIKLDNCAKLLSSSGHLKKIVSTIHILTFLSGRFETPTHAKILPIDPWPEVCLSLWVHWQGSPRARVMSTWTGHDSSLRKQVGAALGLRTYIHTYPHKNSLDLSLVCLQIRKLLYSPSIWSIWA